ncbi:PucR family transcriptional regulator [Cohnella yongneupensis]|uniref:PucR family transcriptional regulator n=1 Tax=Cohnella yongneupensis TaxID=425006 RepID=A0ABW0R980_9BACL
MYLTVEQALSVYPLSEGKLIAGNNGVNRIVKSVNVMDAPDISDWIKEGEMLFTTAYLIKDQPREAAALLDKLHASGSAGLGIKLGRFWSAIPEELVDRANELGFPLIELPYQFTFSDQMNGLFHAEMKKNTGMLQEVLDKQIRLMRLALQSDAIGQLFEAISSIIGDPIAIIGSRGQIVYNASQVPDDELLLREPWSPYAKWVKKRSWQAYSVPLMKQEQCTGYTLFFTPQLYLTSVEESLYVQAAELIAYHLNFNYEDYFELSLQKDFGRLLLRNLKQGLPIDAVNDYASRWEIDLLKQPYRLALTDFPSETQGAARQEKLDCLKRQFLGHRLIQELKGVHLVLDEGVLSLYPAEVEDGGERLLTALDACLSVKGQNTAMPRVAISGSKSKPEQLAEAFEECKETHRLALDWGMNESYLKFETLDLAFVFESVPKERMRKYCDRWLGGLLGKDPEYVQEMMRTLETYLDNDGQLNETAKRMFIHRNTATYRIEKLGELLDVDFKRIDDLLRLKMAFLFRRLLSRS